MFDIAGSNTEFFGRNTNTESTEPDFPILRLGFEFDYEGQIYHRQVVVGFRGLTRNYENGFEAEMWDYKPSDLALTVFERYAPFSIISIEDFDTSIEIPLMMQLSEERTVSFMLDALENLTTDVYIKDTVTNIYYDITDAKKEITLAPGNYDYRFYIVFNDGTLGDNVFLSDQISAYTSKNELIIKSNTLHIEKIVLYTILGQEILQNTYINNPSEVSLSIKSLPRGVYIIKVLTQKGVVSKKIVID